MQVLLNMLVADHSPQQALDAPRVCIGVGLGDDNVVFVEEGISTDVLDGLRKLGHDVVLVEGWENSAGIFGRGQLIRLSEQIAPGGGAKVRVFSAGSDPRGDGMAVPAL